MTRPLKITFIVISVFVLIFILASILAVILFPGEKIKAIASEKASDVIGATVSIGKIGLSFAGIPAIKVTAITVGDTLEGESPLFSTTSVRVRINLIKLLKRQIEIVSVEIDNPAVTLISRKDGSSNLPAQDKPPQEEEKAAGIPSLPLPVSLNTLKVRDATVILDNRATTGSLITIDKINMILNLDVSSDLKEFTSTGETTVKDIIFVPSRDKQSLSGIHAAFNHELTGDLTTGNLTLSKGNLSVNELPISITAATEGWTKVTFTAGTEKLGIENVLKAVPKEMIPEQDKIKADGSFSFKLDGAVDTAPEKPVMTWNGRLDVDISTLAFEGLPKSVDSAASHITFTEKELDISEANIKVGKSQFSLTGTVKDYSTKPVVSLSSGGDVNLSDLTGAFPLPEGVSMSGAVDFHIALNGDPSDLKSFRADGEMNLNNISATVPEILKNPARLNGTIILKPSHVEIGVMSLISGVSDFDFRGNLSNYMTLAGLGEEPALFRGTLQSKVIDFYDLLVIDEETPAIKPWDLEEPIKKMPIPPKFSAVK